MTGLAPEEMTIDELARRASMTARNVRAHQSRGLLPPPAVRGRTGFYGAEHLGRLELIRTLQDDGFNLESIRRLLERTGGSSEELLRFTRAGREPFGDEAPEVIGVEELGRRFGASGRADLLERAVALGLLRPLGDGRFEDLSPRLARAGEELAALGVALEALEHLREQADAGSWSSSSSTSGARSTTRAGRRSAGPRCARHWSGSARSPAAR